jgi:hypothetical protein
VEPEVVVDLGDLVLFPVVPVGVELPSQFPGALDWLLLVFVITQSLSGFRYVRRYNLGTVVFGFLDVYRLTLVQEQSQEKNPKSLKNNSET